MDNAPDGKKSQAVKKIRISFKALLDNNKFVLALSVVIAFGIWVAVAMYKSPSETYTIYSVPIEIDTQNSIVSQRGYENFWQSDDKIDVTVQGPRYLITALTAEDVVVSANLNAVDSAGVSELSLKVSLREEHPDITISAMSKTSVEVYFDARLEKSFDILLDDSDLAEHIAQDCRVREAALTVSAVTLSGPETEMNKIVRVTAEPVFNDEQLYQTTTVPVTISLEGDSAADTVSVNRYVTTESEDEGFRCNIALDRLAQLEPKVVFTGSAQYQVQTRFSEESVGVIIDTLSDFSDSELEILTLDYSALAEGENVFTVALSELELPEGVALEDEDVTITVTVTAS